jgi:FkbM family methyltransferase
MQKQGKHILKRTVFFIFPDNLLKLLKKYHFFIKLKNFKASEEEDLALLDRLISRNSEVIDIGANIGLYTKYMSKYVGESGRVFSIEPVPETFEYLKSNIRKFGLKNVIPLNIAVSEKKGKAIMMVPRFDDKRLNFYEASITDSPNNSALCFETETNTLKGICKQYDIKPSFIKCDVEGYEWPVFSEAGNVLTQYKPILLIEINNDLNRPDLKTKNLLSYLRSIGYEIFVNKNNRLERHDTEKKVNYYFLTKDHIHNLKEVIKNYE